MSDFATTFDAFWDTHFAPRVASHPTAQVGCRLAVKNVLVAGGWSDREGTARFVSHKDVENAISASSRAFEDTLQAAKNERAQSEIQASARVVASTKDSEVVFSDIRIDPSWPVLASVHDKCPRCQGSMSVVALVNGRTGLLCNSGDHVVSPLS